MDAFNFGELRDRLSEMRSQHKKIAVDLKEAKFLSFQAIRYLSDLAEDLKSGGGCLALVSPSEKLKRQFNIYASLDSVQLYRSPTDLSL